jgi:hypothetical protein
MWSVRKGESVNRVLLLGYSGWRQLARAAELDAAAGCAKVE